MVVGHHGTSRSYLDSIQKDGLRISRNDYDWLGDGVYFFQDSVERAREWAVQEHGSDAIVICADIELENCIDLVDSKWSKCFSNMYNDFIAKFKEGRLPIPTQSGKAHRLDRHVINYCVGVLAENGVVVSSLRAPFVEGNPFYPGSALYCESHIQICVRDVSVVTIKDFRGC